MARPKRKYQPSPSPEFPAYDNHTKVPASENDNLMLSEDHVKSEPRESADNEHNVDMEAVNGDSGEEDFEDADTEVGHGQPNAIDAPHEHGGQL